MMNAFGKDVYHPMAQELLPRIVTTDVSYNQDSYGQDFYKKI